MRVWLALLLMLATHLAQAQAVVHARIDRDVLDYTLNADFTYTMTQTTDQTLLTRRGLQALDRATFTFAPDKQSLEVAEAWVDQPDGTRVTVPPGSIFTRPSREAQAAPAFLNTVTTTVLFPQLREGSRTHVVFRMLRTVPHRLGFSVSYNAWLEWDAAAQDIIVNLPASMTFRWAQRGGVAVEDKVEGTTRRVIAHMPPSQRHDAEPAMVSPRDVLPVFLATTLPSAEAIGAMLYRDSAGSAAVTPEIASLAGRIAGDRIGEDAARAIHAWVAANIRYVPVQLNTLSDFVGHTAAEVLKAGFGDSRDFVALCRGLLAARGIDGQAALVEAGTRYADPVLVTPHFADHEILYLPAFDRWLNPVDRNTPYDGLDRRLSGKLVVLITQGGKVTHTPPSTPAAHRYVYTAQLNLDEGGSVHGTGRYSFSTTAESGMRRALANAMSMSALAADSLGASGESGFGSFSASDPKNLLQPLKLTSRWDSPNMVNHEGERIYLSVPQGLDLAPALSQRSKLAPRSERLWPALADASDLTWNNEIFLAGGLKVAQLPPNVEVETAAGRYSATYSEKEGTISVIRHLVIATDVVPAADYAGLRRLLYAAVVDARAVLALETAGPADAEIVP